MDFVIGEMVLVPTGEAWEVYAIEPNGGSWVTVMSPSLKKRTYRWDQLKKISERA